MHLHLRPAARSGVTLAGVAVAAALLAGCSGTSGSSSTGTGSGADVAAPLQPTGSPAPGSLTKAQLSALLLQPADLPDLPQRREYAGIDPTTQPPPQLALCREEPPTAPHQLANVLAQSGQVGQVQVFEIVSAYADPVAAGAAYDQAVAGARDCPTYTSQGRAFTVQDLADVADVPGTRAAHYRLTTPDVVGGDVRTLGVKGRFVLLVTGYGAPPGGQSLLDYQAGVLRRAVARLP